MNTLTFQPLPSDARVLTAHETDQVAGGPLAVPVVVAGIEAIGGIAKALIAAGGAYLVAREYRRSKQEKEEQIHECEVEAH